MYSISDKKQILPGLHAFLIRKIIPFTKYSWETFMIVNRASLPVMHTREEMQRFLYFSFYQEEQFPANLGVQISLAPGLARRWER